MAVKVSAGSSEKAASGVRRRGRPFEKGKSGNPAGRKRTGPDELALIEAARQMGLNALETLLHMATHGQPDAVRIRAAEAILARGYGMPKNTPPLIQVDASVVSAPQVLYYLPHKIPPVQTRDNPAQSPMGEEGNADILQDLADQRR